VRFKESVFSQQVRASVIPKSLWMSAHGSSVFSQQAEGPQTETQKETQKKKATAEANNNPWSLVPSCGRSPPDWDWPGQDLGSGGLCVRVASVVAWLCRSCVVWRIFLVGTRARVKFRELCFVFLHLGF
jgi:hypothetical protein